MTREEAIENIKTVVKHSIDDGYDSAVVDACKMAIEALKADVTEINVGKIQEPCGDCVSRAAIKDIMPRWRFKDEQAWRIADAEIDKLQSVTPAKKGRWVPVDEEPHENYECDNCGYMASTWTANIKPSEEYKYCPNCGAKMEVKDEE